MKYKIYASQHVNRYWYYLQPVRSGLIRYPANILTIIVISGASKCQWILFLSYQFYPNMVKDLVSSSFRD